MFAKKKLPPREATVPSPAKQIKHETNIRSETENGEVHNNSRVCVCVCVGQNSKVTPDDAMSEMLVACGWSDTEDFIKQNLSLVFVHVLPLLVTYKDWVC